MLIKRETTKCENARLKSRIIELENMLKEPFNEDARFIKLQKENKQLRKTLKDK